MPPSLQALLVAVLLAAPLLADPAPYTSSAATPASAETLTFFSFDDYSLPFQRNLYLTMHAPDKYSGNPVIRHGPLGAPDECCAQFYGTVVRQGGKFRMWYLAADLQALINLSQPPWSFHGFNVCYAESDDGIHWTKPDLGLVSHHGNKHNNILELEPSQPGNGFIQVLYEPQDPDPARRYKMMLLVFAAVPPSFRSGAPDLQNSAVSATFINTVLPFYSADGLRWRQAIPGTIDADGKLAAGASPLPLDLFEMGGLSHFQGAYYITGQQISPYAWLPDGSECGRVMSVFHSYDFLHWSGARSQGFIRWGYRSTLVNQGEEVHMPAANWNRGNVLLGVYGRFQSIPDSPQHPMDLGMLYSNDGIHFREPVRDYVLVRHDSHTPWESVALTQGGSFLNVGGETYIYYSGWDSDWWVASSFVHTEIGLARIRRDGFGSISPKRAGQPASFETCALEAHAPFRIWLNADGLSAESRLQVELLDESEQPLPGFSGPEAAAVAQSGLDTVARWARGEEMPAPAGVFHLRVSFQGKENGNARLFALYLGRKPPEPDGN